jgi:hypothetical protein
MSLALSEQDKKQNVIMLVFLLFILISDLLIPSETYYLGQIQLANQNICYRWATRQALQGTIRLLI